MKKKPTKINLNKTKKKNYLTLFDYKINAEILHWGGGGEFGLTELSPTVTVSYMNIKLAIVGGLDKYSF